MTAALLRRGRLLGGRLRRGRLRRGRLWLVLPLLLFGGWQAGQGAFIYAKAALAQVLLRAAWAETLDGKRQARPWPWADTWPVARLTVPRLGVDQIVLAGASGRTLAFGPGHVDGTPAPGALGNSVLGGHRDTHFAWLERLAPGDELYLDTSDGGRRRYRVAGSQVVDHRSARIALAAPVPRLTLVTCWPFDALRPGGPMRYVVEAVGEWTEAKVGKKAAATKESRHR